MNQQTVEKAIIQVLQKNSAGLSPAEITKKIIDQNLYKFKAKSPISIVNHTIRKNCAGINIAISNNGHRAFKLKSDGTYHLNV
jgi:HB1, ASXL, restriction endonuclease HTH domain